MLSESMQRPVLTGGTRLVIKWVLVRSLITSSIIAFLWVTPLLAQDDRSGPVPAVKGTPSTVAVGYSYVNMNLSGEPTANLNGVGTSLMIDFHRHWGATLDSSYVRAGRDPGSGHSSYILSVLAGPVLVPAQTHNTRLLVRVLAGVSLVDSSVRVNQVYYRGWQSRFSLGIGTGIERNLSWPFAVRVNFDYLRTKFVDSAAMVGPQNGVRLTAGLVLRFGPRGETRPIAAHQP